jgi:hypothetical protein
VGTESPAIGGSPHVGTQADPRFGTPTFPGSGNAGSGSWIDHSTATYSRCGIGQIGPTTLFSDHAVASLDPITFDPATATNLAVTATFQVEQVTGVENSVFVVTVDDQEHGDGAYLTLGDYRDDGFPGQMLFDTIITLTYDYQEQVLVPVYGGNMPAFLAGLRAFAATFTTPRFVGFEPAQFVGDDGDVFYSRLYELSITWTYGGEPVTTRIPVTRQYPRDDGLGIRASGRVYPPPRGTRVIGGQQ